MKMSRFLRTLVTTSVILAAMCGGIVFAPTAASAHTKTSVTGSSRCEPSTNRAIGTVNIVSHESRPQHYVVTMLSRTLRVGDFPAGGGSVTFDAQIGTAPTLSTDVNVELWYTNSAGALDAKSYDPRLVKFPAVAACIAQTTTSTTSTTSSTTSTTTKPTVPGTTPTSTTSSTTSTTAAPAVLIPAIIVVRPETPKAQPAKPVNARKVAYTG